MGLELEIVAGGLSVRSAPNRKVLVHHYVPRIAPRVVSQAIRISRTQLHHVPTAG